MKNISVIVLIRAGKQSPLPAGRVSRLSIGCQTLPKKLGKYFMLIIQTQNIKVHALSSQALLATKRDSPDKFVLHKAIVMNYIGKYTF